MFKNSISIIQILCVIINIICLYIIFKKYKNTTNTTNIDKNLNNVLFNENNKIKRIFPIYSTIKVIDDIEYNIEWENINNIISNCLKESGLNFIIDSIYPFFYIKCSNDNYFNFDINLYLTKNNNFIIKCKRLSSEGSYTIKETIGKIRDLLSEYEVNKMMEEEENRVNDLEIKEGKISKSVINFKNALIFKKSFKSA